MHLPQLRVTALTVSRRVDMGLNVEDVPYTGTTTGSILPDDAAVDLTAVRLLKLSA